MQSQHIVTKTKVCDLRLENKMTDGQANTMSQV
jgi:hypothetical protein